MCGVETRKKTLFIQNRVILRAPLGATARFADDPRRTIIHAGSTWTPDFIFLAVGANLV